MPDNTNENQGFKHVSPEELLKKLDEADAEVARSPEAGLDAFYKFIDCLDVDTMRAVLKDKMRIEASELATTKPREVVLSPEKFAHNLMVWEVARNADDLLRKNSLLREHIGYDIGIADACAAALAELPANASIRDCMLAQERAAAAYRRQMRQDLDDAYSVTLQNALASEAVFATTERLGPGYSESVISAESNRYAVAVRDLVRAVHGAPEAPGSEGEEP